MPAAPRLAATLPLLLLLAACGSAPRAPVERGAEPQAADAPRAQPAKPARRPPPVVQKRGGGYYKDDGPADEIPDNLDAIPDAEPRAEPLHRFANRPYVVLGREYTPHASHRPYRERGIASWYGKKFHGQKTSIGEPYDMFAMTAAHPTLPLPSYARVTRTDTGRSVVVRVIDRGPFHADRIIDLSYTAAWKLDYINQGSAPVEVEAILPGDAAGTTYAAVAPPPRPARPPARDEISELASRLPAEESPPPPPPPAVDGIWLQLGAFASVDNAEALRGHLGRELDWLAEPIQIRAGGGFHRVQLGPYASRNDAERVAERIRAALGYRPTLVNPAARR